MKTRLLIIDTNVLVAGLLTPDENSPTHRILDDMLKGHCAFLLSPELLSEYREVLLRPRTTALHGLDEHDIDLILTELVATSVFRENPPSTSAPLPDRGDAHLWALLMCESDAILVTGDKALLNQPPPGRKILTPAEAVEQEN